MRTPSTLRLNSRLFLLVHVLLLSLFPPLLHSTRIDAIAAAICGDVVINEIKFKQDGGSPPPAHVLDEWVELYVVTDLPVGTTLELDDMENSPFYAQFTLATAVPAQNYVVVHGRDEAESESPTVGWLNIFNAGKNKLNNAGDNVILSVNGVACEEVHWGGRGSGNNGPPSPAALTEYAYGSSSNVSAGESIQRNPNGNGPSFLQGDDAVFHARTTIGVNNNDGSVPVTLAWFQAVSGTDRVHVAWQTATETANGGFNLYHTTAQGLTRLNEAIIFSAAVTSLEPQSYSAEFPLHEITPNTLFYLEDVAVNGKTRRHGPFSMGRKYGDPVSVDLIDWGAINAESRAKAALRKEKHAAAINRRVTRLVADGALGVKKTTPAIASAPSAELSDQSFLPIIAQDTAQTPPNEIRIDLLVARTGIYRLTHPNLLAADIDLTGIDAASPVSQGEPTPILVEGPEQFGPDSFIEFWGEGLDSPYTRTNVYTVLIDRTLARRIAHDDRQPVLGATPAPYYLETTTIDANRDYSVIAPNGDPWYNQRLSVRDDPVSWDFPLAIDHLVSDAAPISFTIDLWGVTAWPGIAADHHVEVAFNDEVVADRRFDGVSAQQITATLASGRLLDGENSVTIRLPADTGSDFEYVALDRYAMTYPRAFIAREGRLNFASAGELFTIEGMPSDVVRVYRREPGRITQISSPIVAHGEDGFSITFAGTDSQADYSIVVEAEILSPSVVPRSPVSDLADGTADYVIIAHPDFIAGLAPLVEARVAQGYEVAVVDVEELYTVYSHGIVDPAAIQTFVAEAITRMGAEYFLLVGGDTYDYLNYLGADSQSFIPSLYVQTHNLVRFSPADPLFTDVDADGVPDAAIGRFPVRTGEELTSIIQKTLAYESQSYGGAGIFAADLEDDVSYAEFSDRLIEQLPEGWQITRAYLDEMGVEAAKASLINTINDGVALTSFFGHSGPTEWTFQRLFSADDAAQLTNAQRPTVVSQWGCWNSYYVTPRNDTLAHKFLLSGDRGAAAVLGATTLTQAKSDLALGELLTPKLAQPGMTIGQAVLEAKQELAAQHGELRDVLAGWTILGDPTLKVQP